MNRRMVTVFAGVAGFRFLASVAQAQAPAPAFPSKPVRMLVGYPPGGGVDTAARIVANALNDYWNVPVVVENRSGGTGSVATEAVAKSPRDGYTAMLCVLALERHGVTPGRGPILVTGAAGGVGSVAIALLAKLGHQVVASTGRAAEAAYLKDLGATEVIETIRKCRDDRKVIRKQRLTDSQ